MKQKALQIPENVVAFGQPEGEAVKIIRAHGVEKILFASDYPACNHVKAVDDILKLGLSPQENEQIFHLNAERILGES